MTKNIKETENFIPDINKPHSSDGGIFNIERIMHKDEVSKELKERLENLRQKHELLRR